MRRNTDDILAHQLAECSDLIIAGASVQDCLDRHPEHASTLEPLLNTLAQVRGLRPVPARSVPAVAQGRAQFMAAAYKISPQARRPARPQTWREKVAAWWQGLWAGVTMPSGGLGMPAGLTAALLIVILIGMLGTGAVTASAGALPGDFLYPVKTTIENVRVLTARDPAARGTLLAEFSDRRVAEAKAIAELGRPMRNLTLAGTLEAIHGDTWTVSGLSVTITADTRIEGTPVVGAEVQGRMQAPGDGRLIALQVEIEALPFAGVTPAATATATPPRLTPTATQPPSPTPSSEEHAIGGYAAAGIPTQRWVEPVELPTHVPSATPTSTSTKTPRPTATATVTRLPTVTPTASLPPPRPVTHVWIRGGWVKAIQGNLWTVDDTRFGTDASTRIDPRVGVGWKVDVELRVAEDGTRTAEQIIGLAGPEAPPEPMEFTGILKSTDGEWWTIGDYRVKILGNTQFEGDPKMGDLVSVKAERRAGGEIWALRITAIPPVEVQFQGIIEAINADSLVVGGNLVFLDGQTQIIGQPTVGWEAQVAAVQMPDGRLIARIVKVLEPAPTPTPTPTLTPQLTASALGTPTATPTVPAMNTPTPTPEVTETPTEAPTPPETATPTLTPLPQVR